MCWFSLAHRQAVSRTKGVWCKPSPTRVPPIPATAQKNERLRWLAPEDQAFSTAVLRGELLPGVMNREAKALIDCAGYKESASQRSLARVPGLKN